MRIVFVIVWLGSMTLAGGCQHNETIPTWKRFFPGDERLIGVKVQQHPDNGDHERHKGKHPAMVLYVLDKGDKLEVCQVGFTPDGDIDEVFWWGPPPKWVMEQLQPPPRR